MNVFETEEVSTEESSRVEHKPLSQNILKWVEICECNSDRMLELMVYFMKLLVERKIFRLAMEKSVDPVERKVVHHSEYEVLFEHFRFRWYSLSLKADINFPISQVLHHEQLT
jgi:hypothetical protein